MRRLPFLRKTGTSQGGHCPALYAADGGYAVQGVSLDEAERAQLLELGDNESAVFVPADVLDRLRG